MKNIKPSLCIGFLVCCFSQLSFSQQQYDINDPRNPDCPCHKHQQQAEDEYARQNKNVNVNFILNDDSNINRGNKNDVNGNVINENNINKENKGNALNRNAEAGGRPQKINPGISYTKSKRKHKPVFISKMKFRLYNSKKGLKKVKGDLVACTKW